MSGATARAATGGNVVGVLSALLEARTGQQITNARAWRIDTALAPVLRARGLDSLDQLVPLVLGGRETRLVDQVIDALVNQETSFFRDAAFFAALPDVVDAFAPRGTPQIWSAGCASGQEPLSMAMLFAERRAVTGAAMPDILATDVCRPAIARAKAGRFSQFEIQRGLPIRRALHWFEGTPSSDWIASRALLDHVMFQRHNLIADEWPTKRFDLILCRNVLLYFSAPARSTALSRLAGALAPGGLLALGAGETVIGQTPLLEPSSRHRGFYEAVPSLH